MGELADGVVVITCLGKEKKKNPTSFSLIFYKSLFLCLYTAHVANPITLLLTARDLFQASLASVTLTRSHAAVRRGGVLVVLPIVDSAGRCSPTLTCRLAWDSAAKGPLCCQVLLGCLFCQQQWRHLFLKLIPLARSLTSLLRE